MNSDQKAVSHLLWPTCRSTTFGR